MADNTMNDQPSAARHSLVDQELAKSIYEATTENLGEPKKEDLDCEYL